MSASSTTTTHTSDHIDTVMSESDKTVFDTTKLTETLLSAIDFDAVSFNEPLKDLANVYTDAFNMYVRDPTGRICKNVNKTEQGHTITILNPALSVIEQVVWERSNLTYFRIDVTKLLERQEQKASEWTQMYLTQPPIDRIEIVYAGQSCGVERGAQRGNQQLNVEGGVKMGDLMKQLKKTTKPQKDNSKPVARKRGAKVSLRHDKVVINLVIKGDDSA